MYVTSRGRTTSEGHMDKNVEDKTYGLIYGEMSKFSAGNGELVQYNWLEKRDSNHSCVYTKPDY